MELHSKETTSNTERQVDWDLLRRVYDNETRSCVLTLIAAAILATVVSRHAPGNWIPLAWWLSIACMVAGRLYTAARFRSVAGIESAERWRQRHVVNLTATGILWGVGGALMFLAAPFPWSQAAVLIVVAATAAAALANKASVLNAYRGYLLGAILPLTVVLSLNPRGGTLSIAVLSLVYGAAMWTAASRYNRDQRAGVRMGLDTQALSEQLASANRKLEADIDDRLRAENLLSTERNVLENVARQVPLGKILDDMNLDIEVLFPGSLCSVLLLDPYSRRIRHGSAPKLPDSFVAAVDGLQIGPNAGSCGTAMYRKEQVITEDIAQDPLWQDYRGLALPHGLRACWSTPIISRTGDVLGSFAVYRHEPGGPSLRELETVNRLSRLIALVIEDLQNSEKIQMSEQRFRDFANTAADWFWETDAGLSFTHASERTSRDNWPHGRIMARTREMLAVRSEEFLQKLENSGPGISETDPGLEFEFTAENQEGGKVEVLSIAKPLFDEHGNVSGWRGVGRDITRERQLERDIRYQATHDSLTGLVNRREFESRIRKILERRDRNEYAAFIDLDRFKMINDSAGHPAGDAVLKRVAELLSHTIHGDSTAARLGGDEFGLVFGAPDNRSAVATMEQVLRDIGTTRFEWGHASFRLGASVGLVPITPSHGTTARVLSDADTYCYRAKNEGGNRVCMFQTELDLATDDARHSGELIQALENSRAAIHVQRIQHLHNAASIPWYEVLLRYETGDNDRTSPTCLIPATERYGRMGMVDVWVLEQALTRWGELLSRNSLRLSLNLSATSILNQDTATEIIRQVEQARVSPGTLCFEITETSVLDSLEDAARFMRELHGLGCGFVIDNFGSGQSNFSYLKALPGDYLAIHGGYVRTMTTDTSNRAIVDAIHKVGRAHGMRTLAKHVESEPVFNAVLDLSIDFAQGYHIGRAFPAAELVLPAAADVTTVGGAS